MPYPQSLPEDRVLLRHRDFEGLSESEIAGIYGVTRQAVNRRFAKMGRTVRNTPYRDVVPWRIKKEHRSLNGALRLYEHIRSYYGGKMTSGSQKRLRDWHKYLRTNDVVLDYQPDSAAGWRYLPRTEADDDLVLRWPAEAAPPNDRQKGCLSY